MKLTTKKQVLTILQGSHRPRFTEHTNVNSDCCNFHLIARPIVQVCQSPLSSISSCFCSIPGRVPSRNQVVFIAIDSSILYGVVSDNAVSNIGKWSFPYY